MTDSLQTHTVSKVKLNALIICSLGAMFYGYNYLLRIEPGTIVPTLMHFFNTDATHIGALTSMYYNSYVPMQLLIGLILDRFAPRRTLAIAAISCVFGSILFGSTKSMYVAELGRFLIGMGSAFAYVGALKLGTIWLPPRHFATYAGCTTSFGMLSAAIGNIVYTKIMVIFGWQHVTYVLSALGVVLAFVIYSVVRDQNMEDQALHHHQAVTFKDTFDGLLLTVRNRQVWLSGLIGLAFFLPIQIFSELWGNFFLKGVFHYSRETAAFAVSITFVGTLLGSPLAGWMANITRSNKIPLYIGCGVSAVCMLIMIYGTFLPKYAIFFLLFTYSFLSGPHILCFSISRESTPHHIAATALAFTNFLVMIGGIVFQPLLGKFLDMGWKGQMANGIRVYPPEAYQTAMLVLPIVLFLGVVCAYFLKETYTHNIEKALNLEEKPETTLAS